MLTSLAPVASQAAQGHARHTPQASTGRTRGGMAGGGASTPSPSAHQLEPPDAGVLLPVDQPPSDALSSRHTLSRLHMGLARGVTVGRMEILRQSARL